MLLVGVAFAPQVYVGGTYPLIWDNEVWVFEVLPLGVIGTYVLAFMFLDVHYGDSTGVRVS